MQYTPVTIILNEAIGNHHIKMKEKERKKREKSVIYHTVEIILELKPMKDI